MGMNTAVMYEKVTAMSVRIKKILKENGASVIETDSESKFFSALEKIQDSPDLIILDVDLRENGVDQFITETKKRAENSPILVLTGGGGRSEFVSAFSRGASDFIVKPFADQIFISKANKYLNNEYPEAQEVVSQSLDRCIAGELRKAEKGAFPLSLMFLGVRHIEGIDNPIINKYILRNFKALFWDTDVFIHFSSGYYFGIFPFCDEKNTAVVDAKLVAGLERMKKKKAAISAYKMTSVFVSYPGDSTKTASVYGILKDRVKDIFGDINVPGF